MTQENRSGIRALFLLLCALALLATGCVMEEMAVTEASDSEVGEVGQLEQGLVSEPAPAPVPKDILVKYNCNSDCRCPTLAGCTPQHILCYTQDNMCQHQQNGCEAWCPQEDQ